MKWSTRSILTLFNDAAPFLTLAALLILSLVLPNRATYDPALAQRQREIREAMTQLPYTVGSWVGTEIAQPTAAVELLHPNAILSRRYEKIPSGPVVNMLIVHCSDVRDMLGHYPPVCYPSNGWSAQGGESATIVLNGREVSARMYEFDRTVAGGRTVGIRIFNFFILPDGQFRGEMVDIYEQSERLALSIKGVAQVQLITSVDMPVESSIDAVNDIGDAMAELFEELGVGKGTVDARR